MKKPLEIGRTIFVVDIKRFAVLLDMKIFVPEQPFNLLKIGHLFFNSLEVLKNYDIKNIPPHQKYYDTDTKHCQYSFYTTNDLATSFLKKILRRELKTTKYYIDKTKNKFFELTDEYSMLERKLKEL